MYKGNNGIIGAIAFGLTGICYKVIGTSSKLFGKILFFLFLKAIPKLLRFLISLFFNK